MMEVVICTTNKGKLHEFKLLMEHDDTPVKSIAEVINPVPEIVEDGKTFVENAKKKVQPFPAVLNRIYISDDSGLEVHCLGGAPGILSARYGGKNATDHDRCIKILADMQKKLVEKKKDPKDPKNRTANFTCAIAIKYHNGVIETFEGHCHGHIALAPKGLSGFGYDPIFIPEGFSVTMAELSLAQKNKVSHRSAALLKLAKRMQEFGEKSKTS